MIGEYNTQREGIILKEYGRNVQKLVNYIRTIPDKEKRTKMATTLIELIKQLAPVVKEPHENPQRMWDDLYIIADFNLDIDNPFTTPDRTILFKKPRKMEYPQSEVRFKHYGKNVERLIKEAIKKEDPQEREEASIYLGKLMKTFHSNWNKETLDDSVIVKDLKNLSQGKLVLDLEKVREENLFEKLYRERKNPRPNDNRDNREGGRDNSNRNRNPRFNKNRRGNNPHRRRDQ
ncbi:MAG: DUF4290 domain-containing protein [Cytophagales bacterium]|jgi:hypothetical protein|nr:DUF4290 domain-containing protein [Cytophagales bacterium]MCA6368937.1 DUF4290 domain-containing protein [Cytophagales bacterium]MCA6372818.1 DUF4290 domain-containing protein [Cytophagales bacterium]MCA6374358.1 DUF4290 domain-containing protein [Cytophagales bacterium]MCA6384463.1 DUF4290 domain-containing protein [Cytophagales bacterium]